MLSREDGSARGGGVLRHGRDVALALGTGRVEALQLGLLAGPALPVILVHRLVEATVVVKRR